jgi:hypothetical protein
MISWHKSMISISWYYSPAKKIVWGRASRADQNFRLNGESLEAGLHSLKWRKHADDRFILYLMKSQRICSKCPDSVIILCVMRVGVSD